VSDILTGKVIRAGTFPLSEDESVDGIVVEISRDQLRDFPHQIAYADVCVITKSYAGHLAWILKEMESMISSKEARIADLEKQLAERR
jgi:hypothetical protein